LSPMSLPSPRAAQPGDPTGLADARIRFLTADPFDPAQVRERILASWWRSRRWNVDADRISLPYVRDPNLDTPLTHSAAPVLDHLAQTLDGQPVSIILTDVDGVVLGRLTGDKTLERHLDGVQLATGFSYSEQFVGTNGIGTALEGREPMQVFGHEHYAEHLEDLACAGVPIHHPTTGKMVGVVDLTCWRKDASPLLMTLAKTTADQIQHAMLNDSGKRELALFREYLRTCRRQSGIVLALNNDVVMMNDYARQTLDPADQTVLLGHAAEALAAQRARPSCVDLPTGIKARVYCRPVKVEGGVAGGVVHVKLLELGRADPAEPAPARTHLPGVVGSGPMWARCCQDIDKHYGTGEWIALEGERGVGKLAVVRAVHQRRNPAGRLRVLDASEAGQGRGWTQSVRRELAGAGTVVLRHVDRLDARNLHELATVLQEARSAPGPKPWLVATLRTARKSQELTRLLQHFPSSVDVPPLRHHVEDLHELVPFFLVKLSHGGRLVCAPEAMQVLMRSKWPGNVGQLYEVLKTVVHRRRTGTIQVADLPPECRTVTRRVLSPLESIERDAIVQSLMEADGNKGAAARSLGVSRATIYRKIREYGIVTGG
jgi:sigma-54 dependent transcriptional regulator, acetoin dehydrogenase operon transcriptional activator AcoR